MGKPGVKVYDSVDPLDLIELYRDEGWSIERLAQRYNVNAITMRDWFSRFGISHLIRGHKRFTPTERAAHHAKIRTMLAQGKNQSEIADTLHVSKSLISRIVKRYRLKGDLSQSEGTKP